MVSIVPIRGIQRSLCWNQGTTPLRHPIVTISDIHRTVSSNTSSNSASKTNGNAAEHKTIAQDADPECSAEDIPFLVGMQEEIDNHFGGTLLPDPEATMVRTVLGNIKSRPRWRLKHALIKTMPYPLHPLTKVDRISLSQLATDGCFVYGKSSSIPSPAAMSKAKANHSNSSASPANVALYDVIPRLEMLLRSQRYHEARAAGRSSKKLSALGVQGLKSTDDDSTPETTSKTDPSASIDHKDFTLDSIRKCGGYKRIFRRDLPISTVVSGLVGSVFRSKRSVSMAIAQACILLNGCPIRYEQMPLLETVFLKTKLPSGEISHFAILTALPVMVGGKLIVGHQVGVLELVDDYGNTILDLNEPEMSQEEDAIQVVEPLRPHEFVFKNKVGKGEYAHTMSDYVTRLCVKLMYSLPPYDNPSIIFQLPSYMRKYLPHKLYFPDWIFAEETGKMAGLHIKRDKTINASFGNQLLVDETAGSDDYVAFYSDKLQNIDSSILRKLVKTPLMLDLKCAFSRRKKTSKFTLRSSMDRLKYEYYGSRCHYYEDGYTPSALLKFCKSNYVGDLAYSMPPILKDFYKNSKEGPLSQYSKETQDEQKKLFYRRLLRVNKQWHKDLQSEFGDIIDNSNDSRRKILTLTKSVENRIETLNKGWLKDNMTGLLDSSEFVYNSKYAPKNGDGQPIVLYDDKDEVSVKSDENESVKQNLVPSHGGANKTKSNASSNTNRYVVASSTNNGIDMSHDDVYESDPESYLVHEDNLDDMDNSVMKVIDEQIEKMSLVAEEKNAMFGSYNRADSYNDQMLAKFKLAMEKAQHRDRLIQTVLTDSKLYGNIMTDRSSLFYPGMPLFLRGDTKQSHLAELEAVVGKDESK